MASVGDFTPATTTDTGADPDTFEFFGRSFDIPARVGTGSSLRFTATLKEARDKAARGEARARAARTEEELARANTMVREADGEAEVAIYYLLQGVIGREQLPDFLDWADQHGADLRGLLDTCREIQAVIADRPTRPSIGSSDGRSTSGTGSLEGGLPPTVPGQILPPKRPTAPAGETPLKLTPMQEQAAYIEAHSVPVR